jgi:hypothetical protein
MLKLSVMSLSHEKPDTFSAHRYGLPKLTDRAEHDHEVLVILMF